MPASVSLDNWQVYVEPPLGRARGTKKRSHPSSKQQPVAVPLDRAPPGLADELPDEPVDPSVTSLPKTNDIICLSDTEADETLPSLEAILRSLDGKRSGVVVVDCEAQVPTSADDHPPKHQSPSVPGHEQAEQTPRLLGREAEANAVGVGAHTSDGTATVSVAKSAARAARVASPQQAHTCLQNEPGENKADQDTSATAGIYHEPRGKRPRTASPGLDTEQSGTEESVSARPGPENCPSSHESEAGSDGQSSNEEEPHCEPGITTEEVPQDQEAEESTKNDRAADAASEASDYDEPPHKRHRVRSTFARDQSPGEARNSRASVLLTPALSVCSVGEETNSGHGVEDSYAAFDEWCVDATVKQTIVGGVVTRTIQFDLDQCMEPLKERCHCHEGSKYQRKSIVANRKGSGRKRRDETKGRRCGICEQPGHNARTCSA